MGYANGARVLIAYAKLGPGGHRPFLRRFWFVNDNDPYPDMFNCPMEGVHPSSIKAGEYSLAAFPILQAEKRGTPADINDRCKCGRPRWRHGPPYSKVSPLPCAGFRSLVPPKSERGRHPER